MTTAKALRKLTRLVKDNDARNEADAIELSQQIHRLEATIGQYQSPAESAGAAFARIWHNAGVRKTVMSQLAEIHATMAGFPALASDLKSHVHEAARRLDTLKPELQGINAGMAKLRNEQSTQASRLAQVEDWLRFGYQENTQMLKALVERSAPAELVVSEAELSEVELAQLATILDRLSELSTQLSEVAIEVSSLKTMLTH